MGAFRKTAAGLLGLLAATVLIPAAPAAPAAAAYPGTPGKVAFIRAGNLFVAEGGTVYQATTGGGYEWPRWQPGGSDMLAVLKDGNLFLGYYSTFSHTFGATQQITFSGSVGAAAWSPDGNRLAYAYGTLPYSPTIYIAYLGSPLSPSARTRAVTVTQVRTHLSPAAQQAANKLPRKAAPKAGATAAAAPTAWHPARNSLAVAWSPNGQWIAYPNGECWAIFDNCLAVLEVATGAEWWATAFGGGGATLDGFATVPAFTADSSRVLWTEQTRPRYEPDPQLSYVHINSGPVTSVNPQARVGVDGEHNAAPSPAGGGSVLVTAGRSGVAWVALRDGSTRTWLYQGYQPDWQAL